MKRLIGCMAVLCLLALTVGCGGVTSNGTLAYVANSSETGATAGFTVFQVNTNGTLTLSTISPQPTKEAPLALTFSPSKDWAYFLDNTATVQVTQLSPTTGLPVPTGFSYSTGTTLYVYTHAGNGTLATFIASYALNNGASSLAVSGNYLYVAEPNAVVSSGQSGQPAVTGELQVFAVDQQTGTLSGLSPVPVGYSITQLLTPTNPNATNPVLFGLSPSQQTVVSWNLSSSLGTATQAAQRSVGTLPDYMILSANGSYMYIPDFLATTPNYPNAGGGAAGSSPQFYAYSVGANGVLSPLLGQSTSPVFNENADLSGQGFPAKPVGGATSSDSRYLFLVNSSGEQNSSISVFKIANTTNGTGIPGEPTEVLGDLVTVGGSTTTTQSPFPCGTGCSGASFAAVPKVNNALYVLSPSANLLYQFSVNENSGVLRPLNPPSVGSGLLSGPSWITIH